MNAMIKRFLLPSLLLISVLVAIGPAAVLADAKPVDKKDNHDDVTETKSEETDTGDVGTLEDKTSPADDEQPTDYLDNYAAESAYDHDDNDVLNNYELERDDDETESDPNEVDFDLEPPTDQQQYNNDDDEYNQMQEDPWRENYEQEWQDLQQPEEEQQEDESNEMPNQPEEEPESDSVPDNQQPVESAVNQTPEEPVEPVKQEEVVPEAPQPVHDEEAENLRLKKKAERMIHKGQAEFMSFTDPEITPSLRKSDRPAVSVKRASQLEFNDGGQNVAMGNAIFIAVLTVCCAMAVTGLALAGVAYYRVHMQQLAAQESEYPQYGVIGPGGKAARSKATARGDQRMAYNAQLHHYQQTKEKIISMERSGMEQRERESDGSEDEAEEGDYSVYECPGLAPTGDIEVSNPMFEKATTPTSSKPAKE